VFVIAHHSMTSTHILKGFDSRRLHHEPSGSWPCHESNGSWCHLQLFVSLYQLISTNFNFLRIIIFLFNRAGTFLQAGCKNNRKRKGTVKFKGGLPCPEKE
jgi:hypothetical protein